MANKTFIHQQADNLQFDFRRKPQRAACGDEDSPANTNNFTFLSVQWE